MQLGDLMNATKPEPKGYSLVPEGAYIARIEKTELKTSAKGNEYINCQLSLYDDPAMEDKKGTVFWMMLDMDWCAYRNKQFFEAIGMPLSGDIGLDIIATAIEKQALVANIIHEDREYNGETKTRAVVDGDGNPFIFAPLSDYLKWDAVVNKGEEIPVDDGFMDIAEGEF